MSLVLAPIFVHNSYAIKSPPCSGKIRIESDRRCKKIKYKFHYNNFLFIFPNATLSARRYSIINHSLLLICKKREKMTMKHFFIIDMKSEFLYKFCCFAISRRKVIISSDARGAKRERSMLSV